MPRRSVERALTIGAVLAHVQDEFPDITISKIRFLESEGLLEPSRSPSGYRQFSTEHVERLRYILRAQRDHFWPLKVIKESLDALDRGLEGGANSGGRPVPPVPSLDADIADVADVAGRVGESDSQSSVAVAGKDLQAPRRTRMRLTRAELMASAVLEPQTLTELESHGLIRADAQGHYDDEALRIAHACSGLGRYGIEARHLRPFRTAADREVGLIRQAVAGLPAGARADGETVVARLSLQLHAALLKSGLHGD